MEQDHIVVDTNVLLSQLINKDGAAGQAVSVCMEKYIILQSQETFIEFVDVINREKFSRYLSKEVRTLAVDALAKESEFVEITHGADVCRDPKDNKFLELAVSGAAKYIVSGDKDLLELGKYQEIEILSPSQFLERERQTKINSLSSHA